MMVEWTNMPILEGRFVRLSPMGMARFDALFEATAPDTFVYFPGGPRAWSRESFRGFVEGMLGETNRWMMLVEEPGTGRVLGSSSFMDMRAAHLGLEIGSTWYSPHARGTLVNPECKLLMLAHAFDVLGCERVQLKCDWRNERSKRAIAKMGATFEGVLRKHMVMPDGFVRDTAMFSVIKSEWPGVRARLEQRLSQADRPGT
jgi:aminoglycoside 6'-N-acetyltransferase/ribosomal-protein-alanine N-acetyltransferase